MAGSLNKVILLGNLGQDPDLKYTQSGTAVCSLRVATNESWMDRQGERQEKTEWHSVVVWDKQAENCEQYLSKGRTVLVEGKLQTRKWEDQNGNDRYSTEIVASRVQFVGGGESGGENRKSSRPHSSGRNRDQGRQDDWQPGGEDDIPF